MATRRQFREMEVIAVLLMQGAILPCKRCRLAISIEQVKAAGVQKEHLHELALGGDDEPHNCAYSHTDCHKVQTNGAPATTAGSSKNRIAKATNKNRIEKFVVQKTAPQPQAPTPQQQNAPARCRGCGGYPGECSCPAPMKRSSFGQARRA